MWSRIALLSAAASLLAGLPSSVAMGATNSSSLALASLSTRTGTGNATHPAISRELQDRGPKFDIWVLQMFWWPGACTESKANAPPLCRKMEGLDGHLVVHGLWPSYSEKFKKDNYLETAGPDGLPNSSDNCVGAAYVPPHDLRHPGATGLLRGKYINAIPPAQASGTPASVQDQKVFPGRGVSTSNFDFYQHEYTKHGRCSRMTQEEYFAKTVELGKEVNERVRALLWDGATKRASVNMGDLIESTFADDGKGSAAFGCTTGRNHQLWFINFCFEKGTPRTGGLIGPSVACKPISKVGCAMGSKSQIKATMIQL